MFGKLVLCACVALALAHEPNPNSNDQCPPDQSHYLLPHEWDCTKFYYCEYGKRWDEPRDCAPGTQFSYELQVCVHPALANCTLSNVPPTEGTTEEPKTTPEWTTTTTQKPTTTPEPTTTTYKPTTTTYKPTTTPEPTTTTYKPTTTPEPTTTTYKPTTTPEPTTTTYKPTTTPEPTTTTYKPTTTPEPTTTTYKPTTTPEPTTTTYKPTTTPEPTTTTYKPTTTPEPTTTTYKPTTTPEPTTTTYKPTTTTYKPTTTPEPTTTTYKPTTTPEPTTTTYKPTTTTQKPTTTPEWTTTTTQKPTATPEPTTTTYKPTTTTQKPTTTPEPTTTTQEPSTDCPRCGLLPNGCPEDFNVFLLLPNEKNCSKFYYCNFGEKVETDCPEGTLFNDEIQVCDWPQNVNCPATTEAPTTEASESEDGLLPNGCPKDFTVFQLLPNEEDCSKFYYCNFGELVDTDCPEGTLFNAEIQVCDWPWNVNCEAGSGSGDGSPTTDTTHGPTYPSTNGPSNSTTQRPTYPTTEGPTNSTTGGSNNSTTGWPTYPSSTQATTTEDVSEGETLPNGCPADWSVYKLLPNEDYCNKFFYCNFGELVETTCPEGTVFNPELSVCDWPQNVDCGSKGIDNGQETTENPNVHPNGCPTDHSISQLLPHEDYCNKFYYCNFGEKVESVCPETLVFNPELQVCDWPYNVNCVDNNGSGSGSNDDKCKDSCNVAPWADHESTGYWRCQGDLAVKVNCSQGLQFNAESGTCDYSPAY